MTAIGVPHRLGVTSGVSSICFIDVSSGNMGFKVQRDARLGTWTADSRVSNSAIIRMKGNQNIQIQDASLLELVQAVADLFPLTAEVRQVGGDTAPALFISWRTEGTREHAGNLNWGVLFRFDSDALEQFRSLEADRREGGRSAPK
jgi:hypothetical protein